jgi:WW domain
MADLDASESSNFSLEHAENDHDNMSSNFATAAASNNNAPSPAASSPASSSPDGGGGDATAAAAASNPATTSSRSAGAGVCCLWQTALDEATGRTYYYHMETRETQWHKPQELASQAELLAAQEKERRQRDFFANMEANILRNLSAGITMTSIRRNMIHNNNNNNNEKNNTEESEKDDDAEEEEEEKEAMLVEERPNFCRTISSMEASVLRNLVKRVPSNRNNNNNNNNNFDNNAERDISVHMMMNGNNNNNNNRSLEHLSLEHAESTIFGNNSNSNNSSNNNNSGSNVGSHRRSSVTAADAPERQPSVGTFLATLPEESLHNNNIMSLNNLGEGGVGSSSSNGLLSMDEFDLNNTSFAATGDESFFDLGVSDEESRALCKLSLISSAMACIKDTGDDDDDDDDIFDFDEDKAQDPDDELDMVQEDDEDEGDTSGNLDVLGDYCRTDPDAIYAAATAANNDKPSLARTVDGSMNMNDLLALHNNNNNNKSSSRTAPAADVAAFVGDDDQLEISLNGQSDFNFIEESSRILGLPSMMPTTNKNSNKVVSSSNGGGSGGSSSSAAADNGSGGGNKTPRPSFSRSLAKRTVVVLDPTTANDPATATTTTAATSRSTTTTRPPSSRSLTRSNKTTTVATKKPDMIRRNTCGTLYVGSTMSAPDKDATIKVRTNVLYLCDISIFAATCVILLLS